MSKFKNRIITISGEPASGKSTVIQRLKEDYEKQGYRVHIFSVGHEFRRIAQEKGLTIEEFNKYMIRRGNIDKMIDSTVAKRGKEINSKEREEDIYIFDSRLAFHNIPDSFSIRLTVDEKVAGERVFKDNKRGKEDCYATLEEAKEDTKKRKESEIVRYKKRYNIDLQNPKNYNLVIDTSYSTVEDIAQVIEQCLELELKRIELQEQYFKIAKKHINLEDSLQKLMRKLLEVPETLKEIELLIEAQELMGVLELEEIKQLIQLKKELSKTKYAKMWTSPKKLLPMQNERDTIEESLLGYSLEEMQELIKENGYYPNSPIEVADVGERLYIIEGHHRNFAAGIIGKTLIPYSTIAKDDDLIQYGGGTARERVKHMDSSYLWGHEWLFDKMDENTKIIERFSYNDVYPGIYKMLEKGKEER